MRQEPSWAAENWADFKSRWESVPKHGINSNSNLPFCPSPTLLGGRGKMAKLRMYNRDDTEDTRRSNGIYLTCHRPVSGFMPWTLTGFNCKKPLALGLWPRSESFSGRPSNSSKIEKNEAQQIGWILNKYSQHFFLRNCMCAGCARLSVTWISLKKSEYTIEMFWNLLKSNVKLRHFSFFIGWGATLVDCLKETFMGPILAE